MNLDRARAFANAWLRAMRVYAGALTRAINEDNDEDCRYFGVRYRCAHARWRSAIARVATMNLAAVEASLRHSAKAGEA